MSARPLPLRIALAGSGWAALLCAEYVTDAAPLRIAAVLVFVLLCPGFALLGPLRPRGPGEGAGAGETLLVVLVLSLSALVVAATGLMLPGWFTGLRTLAVLAALTTLAALLPERS